MAEKDSSNKNDPSNGDEDFGLPKVKFTPIGPEKNVSEENSVKPEIKKEKPAIKESKDSDKEEKKGNGFLIILLLLIIALGLGSLYYFGFFESTKVPTQADVPTPIENEVTSPPIVESDEDDDATGVTENDVSQNVLTEITSRAATPRYFVVVGSFIDNDLAKDYSAKLNKLGNPTFLIHPYGDIAYYRLAVAQYDNVTQALEVMEDKQGSFKENLWVLKY